MAKRNLRVILRDDWEAVKAEVMEDGALSEGDDELRELSRVSFVMITGTVGSSLAIRMLGLSRPVSGIY